MSFDASVPLLGAAAPLPPTLSIMLKVSFGCYAACMRR
jgi:hypothetical protein